ncbi:unnamed protein product [Clavelina lepadiformis]
MQYCEFPPKVKNATIHTTQRFKYESSFGIYITYKCNSGFSNVGFKAKSTCKNGSWSVESLPTCRISNTGCGMPKFLENGGLHSYVPFNYPYDVGEKVEYFCIDGYHMSSDEGNVNFCLNGNEWSLEENMPLCQDCGPPPEVANTTVKVKSTRHGFVAHYICDAGMSTYDTISYVCRNGSWDLKSFSVCKVPVTGCGSPPVPLNGKVLGLPPYIQGNNVTYSCKSTFELYAPVGSINTCGADNKWTIKPSSVYFPKCQPTCFPPPTPLYGHFVNKNKSHNDEGLFSNGATIAFGCRSNYRSLTNSVQCVNGTWNWIAACWRGASFLPCKIMTTSSFSRLWPTTYCGPPPTVEGATIRLTETLEGSWAEYVCDLGLSTLDRLTTVCCGNPPMLSNGQFPGQIAESFAQGTLTFFCPKPFELNSSFDSSYGFKKSSRRTSNGFPSCNTDVYSHDFPNNFYVTCNEGFEILQSVSENNSRDVYCLEAGHVLFYTNKPNRNGSYSNGSMVTLACQPHDNVLKSTTLVCVDGSWTAFNRAPVHSNVSAQLSFFDNSSCRRDCGEPPYAVNASINLWKSQSSVEYVCDPGLSTTDPAIITCLSGGIWNLSKVPACAIPSSGCGNPRKLLDGKYFGKSPYDIGESITYQCDDEFELFPLNASVSTCKPDNVWSLEENEWNFPACKPVCQELPSAFLAYDVPNVYYPLQSGDGYFSFGTTIVTSCFAKPRAFCLGFVWSKEEWKWCHIHVNLFFSRYFIFYGTERSLQSSPTVPEIMPTVKPIVANNSNIRPHTYVKPDSSNETAFGSIIPIDLKTSPNFDWKTELYLETTKRPVKLSTSSDSLQQMGSGKMLVSSLCGFSGFCSGTTPEIYQKCFNTNLFSCPECGSRKGALFLLILLLFGLAIFVGNLLVILVGCKRFKRGIIKKLDICKTSLSVADVATSVQFTIFAVYNFTWSMKLTPVELNDVQRSLQGSVQAYVGGILSVFGFTSSLYHLVFMGAERVYAIAKPIRYSQQSKTSVYCALVVVWLMSLASATIAAWFPDKFDYTFSAPTLVYQPSLRGISPTQNNAAAIVVMVIFYLFPYIMASASCAFTLVFICRAGKCRESIDKGTATTSTAIRKFKLSALKTVSIMYIGFTLTLI